MSAARPTFCGRPLRRSKTLILTQEQDVAWAERSKQFGLSDEVVYFQRGADDSPRPFAVRPPGWKWRGFVSHLADTVKAGGFGLVVIDLVADVWPVVDENSAPQVTEALQPLRQINDAGASVLLLHHPRKSGGEGGTAHRGSSQLAAYAEVLIEMRRMKDAPLNRRLLRVTGRFPAPDELVIELTPEGTRRSGVSSPRPKPGRLSMRT
jgi:hypothetical protein